MPREEALLKIFYLAAAVLFIFGIKGLSHPRTAVRGNLLAALGMLLAIVVALTDKRIVSFQIIVAGIVVGGLVGVLMAYRAPMTAMPQVVPIFNGFGRGASALAVGAAFEEGPDVVHNKVSGPVWGWPISGRPGRQFFPFLCGH